jgi:Rieske Fe-S protein
MDRRAFLDTAAKAVAAGIAATLAGCEDTIRGGLGRTALPAATAAPGKLKIAARSALTSTPTAFPVATSDGGEAVFAFVEGDQVVVMSSVCTHRGCAVDWEAGANRYTCPCHQGSFDKQGQVTGGPPVRPLKAYTAEITAGDVYIQG